MAANIVAGAANALANGAPVSGPADDGTPTTTTTVAVSCDGSLEREVAAGLIGVAVGMLPTVVRGVCRLAAAVFRRLRGPGEEEDEEEEEEDQEQEKEQEQEEEVGRKRKRIRMEV